MGRPVIGMSCMESWGRFANSVFQYAFLRIYAKKYDFITQTPSWIGQFLFGHNDPLVDKGIPSVVVYNDLEESTMINDTKISNPLKNSTLLGYFQCNTKFYFPYKDFFQSLFNPLPEIREIVEKSIDALKAKGNTIIGLHLRRGDFEMLINEVGADCFFIAPCEWYLDWLDNNWDRFDKPVLFIASDELGKVLDDFSKYNPVTNESLGISLQGAPFYPDFYTLSHCDITCISNSSFSFAASILNENGIEFYRPKKSLKALIPYEPWNSPVLLKGNSL